MEYYDFIIISAIFLGLTSWSGKRTVRYIVSYLSLLSLVYVVVEGVYTIISITQIVAFGIIALSAAGAAMEGRK
jgi:amino acid permease